MKNTDRRTFLKQGAAGVGAAVGALTTRTHRAESAFQRVHQDLGAYPGREHERGCSSRVPHENSRIVPYEGTAA